MIRLGRPPYQSCRLLFTQRSCPGLPSFHASSSRCTALHAHFNPLLPRSLPIQKLCTDGRRDYCCMYRGPSCIASKAEHRRPIAIVIAVLPRAPPSRFSEHLRCPHSGRVDLCHSSLVRSALQAASRLACGPSPFSALCSMLAMPWMHVERGPRDASALSRPLPLLQR
jgi:hypothetical protein